MLRTLFAALERAEALRTLLADLERAEDRGDEEEIINAYDALQLAITYEALQSAVVLLMVGYWSFRWWQPV